MEDQDNQPPEDLPIMLQEAIQSADPDIPEAKVRSYDEALWQKIQENSRPFSVDERGRWIDDDSGKQILTTLRDLYRWNPTGLRPLESRKTVIGLSLAASLGDRLAVKKILSSAEFKEGCDQMEFALDHALFFAMLAGQDSAFPALLELGASVNGCSYRSVGSPLQAAVKSNDRKSVRKLLLRGAKCDKYGQQGSSLHIAAKGGSERMVNLLLDHGYDVDGESANVSSNCCHETPLATAALNGMNDMVTVLLSKGADINKQFETCAFGFTPFRLAAKTGNYEAMNQFLRHDIDPYAGDFTVLHDAAFYGHYEAVRLLLRKKVDVNYVSYGDMGKPITPLDAAITFDPYMRIGKDYLNIIRLLLRNHGTTSYMRQPDETDLHWWAEIRHQDMTGYKTLGPKDREDFEEVLKILLKRGVDIDAKDKDGRTPLHRAIQRKDSECHREPHNPMLHIRLLLDYGADPEIKDKDGFTPMDLARKVQWDPAYLEKCPPW